MQPSFYPSLSLRRRFVSYGEDGTYFLLSAGILSREVVASASVTSTSVYESTVRLGRKEMFWLGVKFPRASFTGWEWSLIFSQDPSDDRSTSTTSSPASTKACHKVKGLLSRRRWAHILIYLQKSLINAQIQMTHWLLTVWALPRRILWADLHKVIVVKTLSHTQITLEKKLKYQLLNQIVIM